MAWELMDQCLGEYANELKRIGVPEDCLFSLATSIKAEMMGLDAVRLLEHFSVSYPDAASVSDQVIHNLMFTEKYENLISSDSALNHTAMLANNYIYFVYTQDTYLKAISSAAPKRGPSRAVAKYLTSGEVWNFRNAFAHGKWRYVGEGNPLIEYLPDGKNYNIPVILEPHKLRLWQLLSRTILGFWTAYLADLKQPA